MLQETFAVISEALNSPSTGSNKSFDQWFAKRNRTQEYLDRLGLLGNQRIVLPTYDGVKKKKKKTTILSLSLLFFFKKKKEGESMNPTFGILPAEW